MMSYDTHRNFLDFAFNGDLKEMQFYLEHHGTEPLHAKNGSGETALHRACCFPGPDNLLVAKLLIAR
jgi:hypothetical protein